MGLTFQGNERAEVHIKEYIEGGPEREGDLGCGCGCSGAYGTVQGAVRYDWHGL